VAFLSISRISSDVTTFKLSTSDSSSEGDGDSHGRVPGVGYAHLDVNDPEPGGYLGRSSGQTNTGLAGGFLDDLHLAPTKAAYSRAQGLRHRLFGREPAGETIVTPAALARRAPHLFRGEHPADQSVAFTFH